MRNRALVAFVISVVLAVFAWTILSNATDTALSRLDRIDAVRAYCDSLYAEARNEGDSLRIMDMPLRDTIDARSDEAMKTCGSLKGPG